MNWWLLGLSLPRWTTFNINRDDFALSLQASSDLQFIVGTMSEPKWMQPPSRTAFKRNPQALPDEPYLSWPSHLGLEGLEISHFERILRRDPGKGCQVVKYIFDIHDRQWVYQKATTDVKELKDMVVGTEYEGSYFL